MAKHCHVSVAAEACKRLAGGELGPGIFSFFGGGGSSVYFSLSGGQGSESAGDGGWGAEVRTLLT